MIPLMCDMSVLSNAEYSRPRIEIISSITNLQGRGMCLPESFFPFPVDYDLKGTDFWKLIGTSLTSESSSEIRFSKYDQVGFYNDEYDFNVPLPMVTITKKIKVRSISQFTPKIVL